MAVIPFQLGSTCSSLEHSPGLYFVAFTAGAASAAAAARFVAATAPIGSCSSCAAAAAAAVLQVFAALSVLGTVRVGISVAAFMLIAILQMQLFIYTVRKPLCCCCCCCFLVGASLPRVPLPHRSHWRHGGTMMGMNLVGLVFGSEIFTTSLSDVVPPSLLGTLPRYLLSLPIQAFLAYPFYLLLIGMLTADVINGCRQAETPGKAASQLLGCLLHVLMQIPLYCSTMMEEHPVLCYWAMILNTSIVALRLNLSATCRVTQPSHTYSHQQQREQQQQQEQQEEEEEQQEEECNMHAFCCSGFAAAVLPELLQQQLQQKGASEYGSAVLVGVLVWSLLYIADFLLSTVSVICCHFQIRCFGVGEEALSKKQQ
ncbi:hypothetical protein Emag_000777 [Eimeria magna]